MSGEAADAAGAAPRLRMYRSDRGMLGRITLCREKVCSMRGTVGRIQGKARSPVPTLFGRRCAPAVALRRCLCCYARCWFHMQPPDGRGPESHNHQPHTPGARF